MNSKKAQMTIVIILCIALSIYALTQWSIDKEITLGMVLTSVLIHIAIPSFLAWAIIFKKLQNG